MFSPSRILGVLSFSALVMGGVVLAQDATTPAPKPAPAAVDKTAPLPVLDQAAAQKTKPAAAPAATGGSTTAQASTPTAATRGAAFSDPKCKKKDDTKFANKPKPRGDLSV